MFSKVLRWPAPTAARIRLLKIPLDLSPDRAWIYAPVIAMEEIIRNVPPEELHWCIFCGRIYSVGLDTFQDRTIENVYTGKGIASCDGGDFIFLIYALDTASVIVAALMCAPAGSVFNSVSKDVSCNEQY